MDDDDMELLLTQGKPPSAAQPPRPVNEIVIPKFKVEPVLKPKLKTGAFKPKAKAADTPKVSP